LRDAGTAQGRLTREKSVDIDEARSAVARRVVIVHHHPDLDRNPEYSGA
jgi:hypothetical protein